MTLDPFLQAYIRKKASEPRISGLDVAGARASKAGSRFQIWPGAGPVTVRDVDIPMDWGRCRARFYWPQGNETLPLVVFLHGGGFVVCDIETHDGFARGISGGAQVAVLSVDYRRAPEHPCPAGVDDAVASLKWSISEARGLGIDPAKVFLAGDSAGGNLAVAAALRLVGESGIPPLAGQVLCYPVVDAPASGHRSYDDFAEGFGLTRQDMEWFWAHYVQDKIGREAMP
ncbi:alpha/beta hydrolase, partial [Bradyrhizobium macuxiense]|uniref:alpha/beta hydrolase n=1 Tax=Bradyrhizobium macuxiense TaxID=1755647 RepID=UPI0009E9D382